MNPKSNSFRRYLKQLKDYELNYWKGVIKANFVYFDLLKQKGDDWKMKLLIKKKYFDEIKSGKKTKEYRDSHITFICEETGENLRMEVEVCSVINRKQVPLEYRNAEGLTEEKIIKFWLVPSIKKGDD